MLATILMRKSDAPGTSTDNSSILPTICLLSSPSYLPSETTIVQFLTRRKKLHPMKVTLVEQVGAGSGMIITVTLHLWVQTLCILSQNADISTAKKLQVVLLAKTLFKCCQSNSKIPRIITQPIWLPFRWSWFDWGTLRRFKGCHMRPERLTHELPHAWRSRDDYLRRL